MMMKQNQRISGLLVSILLLAAAVAMTACAPASAQPTPSAAAAATSAAGADATAALRTFTAEELAKYDGKNGSPAYVAINGTVYDVTDFSLWKDGIHQGRIRAGQDLSEEIKKSPHGVSKLDTVPVVGTYVD